MTDQEKGDIKKAFGIVSPSEDIRKHNEQVGKWIEQGMIEADKGEEE